MLSDGPMCNAFDKYHAHSKMLYQVQADADAQQQRDPKEFGKLWLSSKKHSE